MPSVREMIFGAKPTIIATYSSASPLRETYAGKLEPREVKRDIRLGILHPENYDENELFVSKIPIVAGAIDKMVDYVVGQGFYIESDNPTIAEYLETFLNKHKFSQLCRRICRDMLVYGNSYVELSFNINVANALPVQIDAMRCWNPKHMFVDIDEHGSIIGYKQEHKSGKPISFSKDKIVHFKLNSITDMPYGLSILEPLRKVLTVKVRMEHDSARIVTKKANAPLQVIMGGEMGGQVILPTNAEIQSMMQDLTTLENRNEFATSKLVEMKPIDFNIGKEMPYLEHFDNQVVYGLQVPYVLLGLGSIPEGLANVQMESFLFRVQAIQDVIDEMVTEKILTPHLQYSGLAGNFEFTWGAPEFKKDKELGTLKDLLGTNLSEITKTDLENRLRTLMDFKGNIMATQRPVIMPTFGFGQPGAPQGLPFETGIPIIKEGYDSIKEFVGFEYSSFLEWILKFLDKQEFDDIKSLDKRKTNLFRDSLANAFKLGYGISGVAKLIQPFLKDKEMAEVVARSEVSRAANEGKLMQYKEQNKVEKVEWVATQGERTCEFCRQLNGKVFEINKAKGLMPKHPNCRCTWAPIV